MSGDGGRGPRLNRSYLPHAPDDNELRFIIENGIPPGMPDAFYLSKEEIANVAAHIRSLARLPGEILVGDSVHGADVYARSGCSACHIHNGKGIGFGPDLTGIGDRRSASFIRSVVSNPASELPDGFLLLTVVTPSGKSVTGIRLNEDTFSIQIKDDKGRIYSFRKKELKRLKRETGKTPMPSFRDILSPSDLQDLAVFLASSQQTP
jgi:cytochrome c oxidase cbb3-type subunit 3